MIRRYAMIAALVAAGVFPLGACQLPLDHAACPCAVGWVCCPATNVCVAGTADRCPGDSGGSAPDDAPSGDGSSSGGPAEIQRIQLAHGWDADRVGSSVALAGDLAAIGAPGRDGALADQGAVVVFERRGEGSGSWIRTAELVAPDPASNALFGMTVAFAADDALLVGAQQAGGGGRVYLFRRARGAWAWQQTLAPEVGGAQLSGRLISADAGRVLVAAGPGADLYAITAGGATRVARLELPGGAAPVAVALRGGSAVILGLAQSMVAYGFEEAAGWAAPELITTGASSSLRLAFDGARIALGSHTAIRILERSGAGWGAPSDLALPTDPGASDPPDLAWRSGELFAVAPLPTGGLGLLRARPSGGGWQLDPAFAIDASLTAQSRLAVSGDRAMVGIPFAAVAAIHPGQVQMFHIEDGGFSAEAAIGFDEPPLPSDGSITSRDGNLLIATSLGSRVVWLERDAGGRFQRRPSLVLDSGAQITSPIAASGSHVLVAAQHSSGALPVVHGFELLDGDWTAGPALFAPEPALDSFASAIAIDGDVAAITAVRVTPSGQWMGVALVYAWSGGGWVHETTLDTGLLCASTGSPCAQSVAIAGTRIAVAYDAGYRLYERIGATWYERPAPELVAPAARIVRLTLSSGGDAAVIDGTTAEGYVATEAFRWTDGQWHRELELRSDRRFTGCTSACQFGAAAVAPDRLAVFRDASSLARYQLGGGAWIEQPALELPAASRSPGAFIQAAAFDGAGAVVAAVAREGDGVDPLAGALYVVPWR